MSMERPANADAGGVRVPGGAAAVERRGSDKQDLGQYWLRRRSTAAVVAGPASAAPPAPIDPQNWSFQDNLTWADYKPIPGPDYRSGHADARAEPHRGAASKWRVALILVDYPDRPFTITQAAGATDLRHAVGARAQHPARAGAAVLRRLPQQAVSAEQLPDHEPVLDGGLVRPVRRRARAVRPVPDAAEGLPVPHRQLPERGRRLPEPDASRRRTRRRATRTSPTAARNAWLADIDADGATPGEVRRDFDNMFWTSAGQDESGAWQEFGEMRFTARTP